MSLGGGRYDAETEALCKATRAEGVIVIVIGGARGHGFEVHAPMGVQLSLPALLRNLANRVEADIRAGSAFRP